MQDLVFLQNGMLQPFLRAHGLADNTQALLYLSASADGSCTDGKRTVVCGRSARAAFYFIPPAPAEARLPQRASHQVKDMCYSSS